MGTNLKPPYFIDLDSSPTFTQMAGLDTTVITGLLGEKMMMVLKAAIALDESIHFSIAPVTRNGWF